MLKIIFIFTQKHQTFLLIIFIGHTKLLFLNLLFMLFNTIDQHNEHCK